MHLPRVRLAIRVRCENGEGGYKVITLIHGNAFNIPLADKTVQCCISSPPYWGLRDYGIDGQLGLESTPELYVEKLVAVFREVWRVLRPDGTAWINLGDSYSSTTKGDNRTPEQLAKSDGLNRAKDPNKAHPFLSKGGIRSVDTGLKPKDLCGIPWRVAFALQADGWYLRSDIIWSKNNPMPESVRDRPTKSHEYLFLLSKSPSYYYDSLAISEPSIRAGDIPGDSIKTSILQPSMYIASHRPVANYRNRRSVWTISTQPYSGAHFATFPEKLVEPCILAGTSEKGCCPVCGKLWERIVKKEGGSIGKGSWVNHSLDSTQGVSRRTGSKHGQEEFDTYKRTDLGWQPTCVHDAPPVPCLVLDPFAGTATVGVVAAKHGRNFVGIELKPEYIELSKKRIAGTQIVLNMEV
jgi:DNA modification methylase